MLPVGGMTWESSHGGFCCVFLCQDVELCLGVMLFVCCCVCVGWWCLVGGVQLTSCCVSYCSSVWGWTAVDVGSRWVWFGPSLGYFTPFAP